MGEKAKVVSHHVGLWLHLGTSTRRHLSCSVSDSRSVASSAASFGGNSLATLSIPTYHMPGKLFLASGDGEIFLRELETHHGQSQESLSLRLSGVS